MTDRISSTRRGFLRQSVATTVAAAFLPTSLVPAQDERDAPEAFEGREDDGYDESSLPGKGAAKRIVVVWLAGGPTQMETFDPKKGHENGGPTEVVDTSIPGVKFAEGLPNLAKLSGDLAVIRSMTTTEGNHQRAGYLVHTGYTPTPTLTHPGMAAIHCKESLPAGHEFDLPNFIAIGGGAGNGVGGGYFGVEFDPFVVSRPGQMPANISYPRGVDEERFDRRNALLMALEDDFSKKFGDWSNTAHRHIYDRARAIMRTPLRKVFLFDDVKPAVKEAFGDNRFGQSCLLASRLLDIGVTSIEISLGGWDTHQNNFERTSKNLVPTLDRGLAALITHLKERETLDSTLILCMGEFGRTPRINGNSGRDHWPRNFCAMLAGGGVQGGRVIGETNAAGTEIIDRPVTPPEVLASVCHAAGADHAKWYQAGPRPMQLVDKGRIIPELFKA